MKQKRIFLVYQARIANVFEVDCHNLSSFGRNAKRLLQHAFTTCEWYARGLAQAGAIVRTVGCNKAGDIINQHWTEDLESLPFSDKFHPVELPKVNPIVN